MSTHTVPNTPPPSGTLNDKQICTYIAEMCVQLRALAQRPKLRVINYLLDMARLEAEKTVKDLPD